MKPTNDSSLVADRSQMAKASSPTLRWSGQHRVLVVNLSQSAPLTFTVMLLSFR
ncbi:MAG: hypothetical protein IGS39_15875 [Calothrix sp. C42_A2020_038]|nr:hypothetical protein [Calothrix sp. C42_A2020_038]